MVGLLSPWSPPFAYKVIQFLIPASHNGAVCQQYEFHSLQTRLNSDFFHRFSLFSCVEKKRKVAQNYKLYYVALALINFPFSTVEFIWCSSLSWRPFFTSSYVTSIQLKIFKKSYFCPNWKANRKFSGIVFQLPWTVVLKLKPAGLFTFFCSLDYSFLEKAVNSSGRSVFELKPFSTSPLSLIDLSLHLFPICVC